MYTRGGKKLVKSSSHISQEKSSLPLLWSFPVHTTYTYTDILNNSVDVVSAKKMCPNTGRYFCANICTRFWLRWGRKIHFCKGAEVFDMRGYKKFFSPFPQKQVKSWSQRAQVSLLITCVASSKNNVLAINSIACWKFSWVKCLLTIHYKL